MASLVSGPEPNKQDNQNMAESVTRHALTPSNGDYKLLLCGVDSLDLSLYVKWKCDWELLVSHFQECREKAQIENGHIDAAVEGRTFIHCPSGKRNFRFHLQFPEFNLYLSESKEYTHTPNLYLSINSEALWLLGINQTIELACSDIASFGGHTERIQPSRCDFCADFKMPFKITEDFFKTHRVSRCRGADYHTDGENLETYYAGSAKAPIRLRIYDKGKEIVKKGKLWFMDLWGAEDLSNILRVEYQLRRPALKQFGVYTVEDLSLVSYAIWHYLTEEWFSLRLDDNDKQERRSIHPWWKLVQECKGQLGPSMEAERTYESIQLADKSWFISHIAGCLPSLAARCGAGDVDRALDVLKEEVALYWANKDFENELLKRAIRIARAPKSEDEAGDGRKE